jgi:hypothetical protein
MWGRKKPGRQHSPTTSAGQFERWLARAPLIGQAEIDAMKPVELRKILGDYEQSLRTPCVEDFADFVDLLARGVPGQSERTQMRREGEERARGQTPQPHVTIEHRREAEPGTRRERIFINPFITKQVGPFALEQFETPDGFALPYQDVLYTTASVYPDYRNWTGSVWRRDAKTVVVRWKPGPIDDVFR